MPLDSWQVWLYEASGLPFDFKNPFACIAFGTLHFVPILIAAMGIRLGAALSGRSRPAAAG